MFKIQRRRQQVARQQGAYKQERPDSKTGMDQEYTEMTSLPKIKVKDTMYIKKEPKDELLIKSEPAEYVEDAPIKVEKVDLTIKEEYPIKISGRRFKFPNKKLRFESILLPSKSDTKTHGLTKKDAPKLRTVDKDLIAARANLLTNEVRTKLPLGITMHLPPSPIKKSGLKRLLEAPLEGYDSYTLNKRMFT